MDEVRFELSDGTVITLSALGWESDNVVEARLMNSMFPYPNTTPTFEYDPAPLHNIARRAEEYLKPLKAEYPPLPPFDPEAVY